MYSVVQYLRPSSSTPEPLKQRTVSLSSFTSLELESRDGWGRGKIVQIVVVKDTILPAAETAPPRTNRTRRLMYDAVGGKSVVILARIRGLVSHRLEEQEETSSQDATQRWPDEEDPEIVHKVAVDDSRPEGPRGIDRRSGVINSCDAGQPYGP